MSAHTPHTPGPWHCVSIGTSHLIAQASDEDFRFAIAKVFEQTYHPSGIESNRDEARANARLIAAAPELLAALREMLAELDGRIAPHGYIYRDTGGMILARAAIAKAEGR